MSKILCTIKKCNECPHCVMDDLNLFSCTETSGAIENTDSIPEWCPLYTMEIKEESDIRELRHELNDYLQSFSTEKEINAFADGYLQALYDYSVLHFDLHKELKKEFISEGK